MTAWQAKSFTATLEAAGKPLYWVIARIPLDLRKAWPKWGGRRVLGEINGFAFKTSLFPGAKGQGHTLLVNKQMQAGAGVRAGQRVRIRLEPDFAPPALDLPAELTAALKADKATRRWFEALPPSLRKGIAELVRQPKSPETRRQRALKLTESLMLAMEGEAEVPPILRLAFQSHPQAEQGWNAMTPIQRRNHLFGIFFVQTVDGRQSRAAKAVADALRIARKGSGLFSSEDASALDD
jgi:uncharacterized protein YdeI (YjbR/CyaY-like superfamily)